MQAEKKKRNRSRVSGVAEIDIFLVLTANAMLLCKSTPDVIGEKMIPAL